MFPSHPVPCTAPCLRRLRLRRHPLTTLTPPFRQGWCHHGQNQQQQLMQQVLAASAEITQEQRSLLAVMVPIQIALKLDQQGKRWKPQKKRARRRTTKVRLSSCQTRTTTALILPARKRTRGVAYNRVCSLEIFGLEDVKRFGCYYMLGSLFVC